MGNKAVKVNPYNAEIISLAYRNNYKLVDQRVGSKNLSFGMVIVEPGGICEPGHDHTEQEEIFFCLDGKGIVLIGDEREEWEISQYDTVFIPPGVYHNLRNPTNFPLKVLWIQSPTGWIFDNNPELLELAQKGEAI